MKKTYDSIDLMKFLLCFLVIALHQVPILNHYEIVECVSRTAVPLYFITSGFLFFGRYTENHNKNYLKKYIRRLAKLYLVWFIVLLPVTLWYQKWLTYGFVGCLLAFVTNLFFGSTFFASWYLMALILGTLLVVLIDEKLGNKWLLVISSIAYAYCCLCGAYGKLVNIPKLGPLSYPYNSFPVSLLWISLGKMIAEQRIRAPEQKDLIAAIILSGILYGGECFLFLSNGWAERVESSFMLVPVCFFLFLFVLNANISVKNALLFRSMSTSVYCMHGSVAIVVRSVFKRLGLYLSNDRNCFLAYLTVAVVSFGLSAAIYYLSKTRRFMWMKAFY